MDFITQNLIGAVAGHAVLGRSRFDGGLGRLALLAGAAGGALPDFDFLLKPLADPALPMQLHRHFTHALLFIPIGGLLAALPFLLVRSWRPRFKPIVAASTIGCATHGLLDTLTSYGTHLYWPFTDARSAWDAMAIIDPIFTGVLLLGVIAALIRSQARATRIAMTLALAYIAFGFVQRARVVTAQETIAAARGHEIERGRVLPTPGNLLVWRSLYEHDGRLWADAVRVSLFDEARMRDGASAPRFTIDDLPPAATTRTREAFRGIESFADGYLARCEPASGDDAHLLALGDMRISMATDGFLPLWGIAIDLDTGAPQAWESFHEQRGGEEAFRGLIDDLFDPATRFRSLPRR